MKMKLIFCEKKARKPLVSLEKNIAEHFCSAMMVEEGGFEPPKLTQQIYSLPPLATREHSHIPIRSRHREWSWWTDSNPRPADYKSAALPAELHQHIRLNSRTQDVYYHIPR